MPTVKNGLKERLTRYRQIKISVILEEGVSDGASARTNNVSTEVCEGYQCA